MINKTPTNKMTLGQKQRLFSRLFAELIQWAYDQGYEVSMGDAFRDPRLHGDFGEKKGYGSANSCHKLRIAGDINLFIDGVYMIKTEDYRPLGQYWESLHSLCEWGGHWGDGNHFSLQHNGFK